jgi:outer membrane biogenesis lipoprotein LolB
MVMNKIIHNFPFSIALALLACACLSGCAGKQRRPPSVQPSPGIATGDILDAMSLQASQLTSLKARVKLKLTTHDQTQPEIKGQLMWTRTHEGELARVTGHGPFGVTVFDCLVAEQAFYLFITSHNAVYVTGRVILFFINNPIISKCYAWIRMAAQ